MLQLNEYKTVPYFFQLLKQKLVKTSKYTGINKQSDVKFWLDCIKYGAVSYSLSCICKNTNFEKLHQSSVEQKFPRAFQP